MLGVQGLTKHYSAIPAVDDVSLTIHPGEVLGYLGPNGSGKSTTVKMITGLLDPTRGHVYFHGRDIKDDLPGYNARSATFPKSRTSTLISPGGSICCWSAAFAACPRRPSAKKPVHCCVCSASRNLTHSLQVSCLKESSGPSAGS
jgi:ABC-type cobalamin/Fe3+-siderophores transport system ATPase subunit